ncbi:ComF family protein [bacterium]|nr:ComF family protein [bacterium]
MRALRLVVDFLYPPRCPACGVRTASIAFCAPCREPIQLPRSPLCTTCGLPFAGVGPDHRCTTCRTHPPRFRQARARAAVDRRERSPLIEALARFKYGRDITLAPVLSTLLAESPPMPLAHDVIVPIPLHSDRLRWRGFNQAVPLARALGRVCGQPVELLALVRTRPTPPQVGLGAGDRRRNVRGAFAVRYPERVQGRTVLLVDDVMTTGATAHECARVLQRAGARAVDVVVLARALDC